ncbi:MAG: hypothetical protein ABFD98_05570, partial [Syntrophobacteraceae bacterium]
MATRKVGFLLLMLCLLVSCGHISLCPDNPQTAANSETPDDPPAASVQAPEVHGPAALPHGKVVILPFADHTAGYSHAKTDFEKRNLLVAEAIHDAFSLNGFVPASGEDTAHYLLDRSVLKKVSEADLKKLVLSPSEADSPRNGGNRTERSKEPVGKSGGKIATRKASTGSAAKGKIEAEKFSAMADSELKAICQKFGANYIIRGRIVEASPERYDAAGNPESELLPFAVALERGTAFAVSRIETYEGVDAEIAGSFLTHTLPEGVEPTENDSPIAFLWKKGARDVPVPLEVTGKAREGLLLQVTLLAQDAETGRIVWLKRATVETPSIPERIGPAADPDRYARAVRALAGSLVDDFSKNVNPDSRAIKRGP